MMTGTTIFDAMNYDGKKKYNPNEYTPFGQQADYAYNQGWLPIVTSNGATTYKNRYAGAFRPVMINNKPEGEIQIVGNKNGLFDVMIKNKKGETQFTIMKGQPFKAVDEYFRSNKNVIQQRADRIGQGQEHSSIFAYKQ